MPIFVRIFPPIVPQIFKIILNVSLQFNFIIELYQYLVFVCSVCFGAGTETDHTGNDDWS